MYKATFGTKQQIAFNSEAEYYEFLGYLSKNDGSTRIVWEENNEQGAWAEEGRILFYTPHPNQLRVQLLHTAGNPSIESRVNCNEFVENIRVNHNFILGGNQNAAQIRATVPNQYLADFDNGLLI